MKSVDEDTLKLCQSKEETVDLEEAQAKYDAMFGKSGIDSYLTARNDVSSLKVTPATESTTSPKGIDYSSAYPCPPTFPQQLLLY